MKRLWDNRDGGGIESRLQAERPEAPQKLIDRIGAEIASAPKPRQLSRARKGVAIAFASLVLTSAFGAVALAAQGGNGGGSNGNGNGGGHTPAGCVEGRGKVAQQNPNC